MQATPMISIEDMTEIRKFCVEQATFILRPGLVAADDSPEDFIAIATRIEKFILNGAE